MTEIVDSTINRFDETIYEGDFLWVKKEVDKYIIVVKVNKIHDGTIVEYEFLTPVHGFTARGSIINFQKFPPDHLINTMLKEWVNLLLAGNKYETVDELDNP